MDQVDYLVFSYLSFRTKFNYCLTNKTNYSKFFEKHVKPIWSIVLEENEDDDVYLNISHLNEITDHAEDEKMMSILIRTCEKRYDYKDPDSGSLSRVAYFVSLHGQRQLLEPYLNRRLYIAPIWREVYNGSVQFQPSLYLRSIPDCIILAEYFQFICASEKNNLIAKELLYKYPKSIEYDSVVPMILLSRNKELVDSVLELLVSNKDKKYNCSEVYILSHLFDEVQGSSWRFSNTINDYAWMISKLLEYEIITMEGLFRSNEIPGSKWEIFTLLGGSWKEDIKMIKLILNYMTKLFPYLVRRGVIKLNRLIIAEICISSRAKEYMKVLVDLFDSGFLSWDGILLELFNCKKDDEHDIDGGVILMNGLLSMLVNKTTNYNMDEIVENFQPLYPMPEGDKFTSEKRYRRMVKLLEIFNEKYSWKEIYDCLSANSVRSERWITSNVSNFLLERLYVETNSLKRTNNRYDDSDRKRQKLRRKSI